MNRVEHALRQAAADLTLSGRDWVLVGGFAVSARAVPSFTRDVDIAVAVRDDSPAEDLVRDLIGSGYSVFGTVGHDNGRLATVRISRNVSRVDVIVDCSSPARASNPRLRPPPKPSRSYVASRYPWQPRGHLIALKLLARDDDSRPRDRADLLALREAATPRDMAIAMSAVQLIMARGYNRDRDLVAALNALIVSGG